ncbi:MAG TPA: type I DNA topoisomerase [Lentisphaeria bacterium]|nr:MAG: DNA topoisomerase I [Lentisphaerae bacterium GWF2_38_69]HBM16270.1 type I DNA topoisomerase [Lentisphaeria bacterium]
MSNKNLVIVESPTKARTIAPMLGKDYTLMASMGHIRDLPEGSRLGIDIKNNFLPEYEVSREKKDVVKKLVSAAKNASAIFLATDPDREGEAISWHIKELLSENTKAPFHRVEFHEITKGAIKQAFDHSRDINKDLVDSQQARRVLDRLVGYQLSPLLWSRIEKNTSAGRVQSVALRIVCEREREIQNFIPKEYWDFGAKFMHENKEDRLYLAKLFQINGKKADISNTQKAQEVYDAVTNAGKYYISSAKTEPAKKYAPPPFITSTLQQSAGNSLRFSSSKTMQIAQQLYEGIQTESGEQTGLITYMRTDSFTVSRDAQNACREFIVSKYGDKFAPERFNFFKNKSTAQEAHEAIRPTDVFKTPESLAKVLSRDQLVLYKLVWKRFIASQMSPTELSRTTIDTQCSNTNDIYTFRTVSTITLFSGFGIIYSDKETDDLNEEDKKYNFLQYIKENDSSSLKELTKEQKFTEPPPRYTEPSLIKELEANGIGRPSTYATIVNTIQNRKYVEKKEGKLIPQNLGFRVNDFLVPTFPDLLNISFTAGMEEKLDNIESGGVNWTTMIKEFYGSLQTWLNSAKYEDAPTEDKAEGAINLLENFTGWKTPDKKTGRVFDDKKFFESVQRQYKKNKAITAKQFSALLRLLNKYSSQITDFDNFVAKFNLKKDLNDLSAQIEEENEKREQLSEERAESVIIMKSVLSIIRSSDLIPNHSFDEKAFVESLNEQIQNNRPLSSKQIYVLKRIAIRSRNKIDSFNEISATLGITPKDIEAIEAKKETPKESNPKIEEFIEKLDKITDWKEEGKRKIKDSAFFASLKKQYEAKKTLSPKQLSALEKIVAKYN